MLSEEGGRYRPPTNKYGEMLTAVIDLSSSAIVFRLMNKPSGMTNDAAAFGARLGNCRRQARLSHEALAERSELSGRHARRRAAAPVAQPGGAAPRGIFPAAGPVVIDTWPGTAALDRARHVPS
jgi:hypothetical protein